MECSIFTPSHITGFFQIMDNPNPLKKGSRGVGVVIDKGVITTIKPSKIDHKIDIKINGQNDSFNDSITRKTIELLKNKFSFEEGFKIDHNIEVPIGCGFGTSASCAMGTIMGLVHMLNIPFSYNQVASVAHQAEVELGTGLGDLIAETTGGIVIRLKEGSPEYGKLDKIVSEPFYVIAKTLGDIDTSSIIQNPQHQQMINKTGEGMLKQILEEPTPQKFMKLSYKFAKNTSLMRADVKEMVDILNKETLGASMAMLGNTAFALSKTPETSLEDTIISKIDFCGNRFLKK
ncbi:pantoate kinase [Methanobacterium alcaliphilum]|uniref:pantoate kinase n=1 Tax=Methanobacterium alcaliphilum TaxID=392018 RepID=UPI00200B7C98|nr:pantoate kinase [Methanobacterium alcaliphilum]MCK9152497.1 pantoate kinase [Methanobacterium alcaliphilum]